VTVHRLVIAGQVAPSLDVPRMHPCEAGGVGAAVLCGATPASLWKVTCITPSHTAEKRLCPAHARMCTMGLVRCVRCADRGAQAVVSITPADLLLLGHIGGVTG
jgi:hypothetical protein